MTQVVKLTKRNLNYLDMIEALYEAADHLEVGTWTLDKGEEYQGLLLAKQLRKRAEKIFNKLYATKRIIKCH